MSSKMYQFAPRAAKRETVPLRLLIWGVSGGGKTWSALELATQLKALTGDERPISVLDTEFSAEKYAKDFDFNVTVAGPNSPDGIFDHHPEMFTEWIKHFGPQSSVLVIDSITHEWNGVNGCLQLVEQIGKAKGGNSYAAWGDITPKHNAFIQSIISCPTHIICTGRGKQEYVLEVRGGKSIPTKVGLGVVTRDGMEYEFDVVLQAAAEGLLTVEKTRASVLQGRMFNRDVETLSRLVYGWLGDADTPKQKYVYGDGTPVKDSPASKRVFGEYVAEHNQVPPNAAALALYHKSRQAVATVNAEPEPDAPPA